MIAIILIMAIMAGAAFCAIAKPGKDENICNYDYTEDRKK